MSCSLEIRKALSKSIQMSLINLLKDVPFISSAFEDGTHDVDILRSKFEVSYAETGDVLFDQGSASDRFYIIAEGTVVIFADADKVITRKKQSRQNRMQSSGDSLFSNKEDDQDAANTNLVVVDMIKSGQFFGEMGLLVAHRRRAVSVVAKTPSMLFSMSVADFEWLLETYPDIGEKVQRLATQRRQQLSITVEQFLDQL